LFLCYNQLRLRHLPIFRFLSIDNVYAFHPVKKGTDGNDTTITPRCPHKRVSENMDAHTRFEVSHGKMELYNLNGVQNCAAACCLLPTFTCVCVCVCLCVCVYVCACVRERSKSVNHETNRLLGLGPMVWQWYLGVACDFSFLYCLPIVVVVVVDVAAVVVVAAAPRKRMPPRWFSFRNTRRGR